MIIFRNGLLELATVQAPGAEFPKHTHDEFVISVNLAGRENVWLDGKTFEVGLDTLTTYNPGQVQASRSDDVLRCTSLYVHARAFETYFGHGFEFDSALFERPDLAAELAAADGEEACLLLLANLVDPGGARTGPARSGRPSAWVARIQERLLAEMGVVPDLAALAAQESMSPAHLVRRFRAEAGLPPLAWFMQQRMAHARRLLRRGRPIAEVAQDSGFADQAHFSKAFVRFTGMTPGRYRQGHFGI